VDNNAIGHLSVHGAHKFMMENQTNQYLSTNCL